MTSYAELSAWLKQRGIDSHAQGADRMLISNENPPRPRRNCFWVTLQSGDWFLGTFLPVAYRVPSAEMIGRLCEDVFHSSKTAVYQVDPGLVEWYELQEVAWESVAAFNTLDGIVPAGREGRRPQGR